MRLRRTQQAELLPEPSGPAVTRMHFFVPSSIAHRSHTMTSFTDGINAGRQAMDYRRTESQVDTGSHIQVNMVRNGGFAAVIK